jgi:hypothetical protein
VENGVSLHVSMSFIRPMFEFDRLKIDVLKMTRIQIMFRIRWFPQKTHWTFFGTPVIGVSEWGVRCLSNCKILQLMVSSRSQHSTSGDLVMVVSSIVV